MSLNAFVEGNGPVFLHYKAVPAVIGQVEKAAIRTPEEMSADISNGFLYKYAGEFKAAFTAAPQTLQLTDVGFIDGASAQLILPLTYLNSLNPLYVCPYDKFYVKDLSTLTTTNEKVECHISGLDRLNFPAVKVEYVIDSKNIEYFENQDFVINNGMIQWTGKRPEFDASTGIGGIYGIRYQHLPFYYVERLLHEIRILAQADLNGSVYYHRGNCGALIVREKYFMKKIQENNQPDAQRVPSSGLFGAR
jgi:hypothetical protein